MPIKKKRAVKVDFAYEDFVKRAMAKELEVDPDDIKISESHYKDFTGDTYYKIEIGSQEYYVAKDNESAYDLAVAMRKCMKRKATCSTGMASRSCSKKRSTRSRR